MSYEFLTRKLEEILGALEDEEFRRALERAVRNAEGKHEKALSAAPYLVALRDRARRAKQAFIDDPEGLIERATRSLERMGARVSLARTARDAVEAVLDVARRTGGPVVMAKSMVAEEIGLREALEREGIEAWETDLGQLLIQLERGRPMHTTAPAIHISVERARRLVSEKLGIPLPGDAGPEEIVAAVRRFLRDKFCRARLGISGANSLAADTGTIVLVENEGNIRLATGLPPVHVAVVGADKIVPTVEDAVAVALVQAAYAGLWPPTYLNLISGPSSTADIEHRRVMGAHGPRELHVVIVDNGRLRAAREEPLREQLRCIRCGRCQWECPVWRETANLWGGPVYGGPMGMGWTAITHSLREAAELSLLCLGCARCDAVCPVEIPLSRLIRWLKTRAHSGGR